MILNDTDIKTSIMLARDVLVRVVSKPVFRDPDVFGKKLAVERNDDKKTRMTNYAHHNEPGTHNCQDGYALGQNFKQIQANDCHEKPCLKNDFYHAEFGQFQKILGKYGLGA